MNDLTAAVLCDRCCTRLHRSIRSSPNGSSSNCSFPSDLARHSSPGYAFSKRPSSCRRGGARSSHESICCHRDHPSRRQSTCHDSHTCPMNCSSCHASDFLDVVDSLTDRAITHLATSCPLHDDVWQLWRKESILSSTVQTAVAARLSPG